MEFHHYIYIAFAAFLIYFIVISQRQRIVTKRLKKWKDEWPKSELIPVFTDALGNNWYTFKDQLKIPAYRGIQAEVMVNQADMCMTPKMLNTYINAIQECLNAGQIVQAYNYFSRIKERTSMLGEETTLLNLAKTFFILEGEDPKNPAPEFDKRKEEIFKQDPEARAFFLLRAFRLMNDASEFSSEDILNYLKVNRKQEPSLN